jgi:hypothetical protein
MNAPLDMLGVAIAKVRPYLVERSKPVAYRLRVFWAGVKAARRLGAWDVVTTEFTALAIETGLLADLGRHGEEDIAHVISWALRDMDPFGIRRRPRA